VLKFCQNSVKILSKFYKKLVTKDTAHMTQYMIQVTNEYFHSFISAHKCYKYRKHTHHPLLTIPYKLVTSRSAQTNIKHFSKNTISLAIPVRSLNCSGCPPSLLDCSFGHLSVMENRLIRGWHMLVINQPLLIVLLPLPKVTSTIIHLSPMQIKFNCMNNTTHKL